MMMNAGRVSKKWLLVGTFLGVTALIGGLWAAQGTAAVTIATPRLPAAGSPM